jgi:hypothetical protein
VAIDTQAMGLLIRMIPLIQREFSLRVEPTIFFDDSGYRKAIIDSALTSMEPRLVDYTSKLVARLAEISAGPPGAPTTTAGTPGGRTAQVHRPPALRLSRRRPPPWAPWCCAGSA